MKSVADLVVSQHRKSLTQTASTEVAGDTLHVSVAARGAFHHARQMENAQVGTALWATAPWSSKHALLSRIVWSVLFAIPTAVMVTAATLTPNPVGHGTHTQLGLPPCGFLVFTGYPCPGCGLTTAFAHMIRLQVIGAWTANPFGIALFLATFAFIPLAALGFVRGWPVVATLDRIHAEKVAVVLSILSLVAWVARVGLQMSAG